MERPSYDCVVIGSGPGGYVAAIRAAQLGMRTAVVERGTVGGRCLNEACIPAKTVLRTADLVSEIDHAQDFGIHVPSRDVDFASIATRRESVISTLVGGVTALLRKNRVDVLTGRGSLTGDRNVVVTGDAGATEITAGAVVLATGSISRSLPDVAFGGRVIGTEGAWGLSESPRRIAVVGAGPSGSEIASAYGRLGTNVLLIEALDRVLPSEDADVSAVVAQAFGRQNIEVHTATTIDDVRSDDKDVTFTFGDEEARVDWLVVAAGRLADVEGLGLDAAGVRRDERGLIAVDAAQRTSVPDIYAIGDLAPGPALAHKASEEGIIAVESIAGLATHPLAHDDLPRATFCAPNVGSFGLTEALAREQGFDVTVGRIPYGSVGAGTVYGDRNGMIKMIGDKSRGEIVGAHIVGSRATDLIQGIVNAKALDGGYSELARIVHGHPTLSEAVLEAARATDGWLIHG